MILERFPEVRKLSPSEKLALVSELWNELEAGPNSIPVSPEIVVELDRRMTEFQEHPTNQRTSEEVKRRVVRQVGGDSTRD